MPQEVALKHGTRVDEAAPIALPREFDQFDGIMFGTPAPFRNMAALRPPDQTGSL
jgi:NAD(P)H dehydrogenase (quinone)